MSIDATKFKAEPINRGEFVSNVILSETKDIKEPNNSYSSPTSQNDSLI